MQSQLALSNEMYPFLFLMRIAQQQPEETQSGRLLLVQTSFGWWWSEQPQVDDFGNCAFAGLFQTGPAVVVVLTLAVLEALAG